MESTESIRSLCLNVRSAVGASARIRWHGVDLVRQRTRDPAFPDRPLAQHRLDFIYQEALHTLAGMPHVRIASVWADVGAVLHTGKKTRAQRRAKSTSAPPQAKHGTKVAALWHLLDLLDSELASASDPPTSHRLILDGSNNQEDRETATRYVAVRPATGFLRHRVYGTPARRDFSSSLIFVPSAAFRTCRPPLAPRPPTAARVIGTGISSQESGSHRRNFIRRSATSTSTSSTQTR